MSKPRDQHDPNIDEELIAYLDGEMGAKSAKQFASRLANDSELRQKLKQHQRAWDLLDELPRTDIGDRFMQTTVEMVALSVADEVETASHRNAFHSLFRWLVGGGVVAMASIAGYALVTSIVAAPNRQLLEDLRVIEHLDEYRAVEDVEFLRALQHAGLFAVEMDDEL